MSAVPALLDAARSALNDHQVAVSGTDPLVIRLPRDADLELVRALAQTATRLYQIVPWRKPDARSSRFFPRRSREREQERDEFLLPAWRAHAQNGATEVRRVYVVPYGDPDAIGLDELISADHQHKIHANRLYLKAANDPPVQLINQWLVDDAVVVYEEYGDTGEPTWVVSARDEEVATARGRWDRLWRLSGDTVPEPPRVREPLLASADIVADLAGFTCRGDHVDDESCLWYHGAWQYLRLYDMVSSPNWHAAFYEEWLARELHRHEAPRVLITGAADYAMLAQVLAADSRPQTEIHVIDRCRTPLEANTWYAERYGRTVHTHDWDFLEEPEKIEALGPADLIVTDAFLTRFPRDDAERIVANWSRMLRAGGALITTVRLRGAAGTEQPDGDYEDRLYARAKNSHWLLDIDLGSLRQAGRRYAQAIISHPLGDRQRIVGMFDRHGLKPVTAVSAKVPGELTPTEYLRIVCHT